MKDSVTKLHSDGRAGTDRARARFLSQAIELEESEAPGVVAAGIALTATLLIGAIVWAGITELSEVARAEGEVIPAGMIHKVQHFEGGSVAEIHVHDGHRVAAGDALIDLAPTLSRSELDQLESRRAGLHMKLVRLRALLANAAPRFGEMGRRFPQIRARQEDLFWDQVDAQREQLALIDAQISQRESEIRSIESQLDAARTEHGLREKLRDMRQALAERKLVARADVLTVSVSLAETAREVGELEGGYRVATHALTEARRRRQELVSRLREANSQEAGNLTSEIAEFEHQFKRSQGRVERLAIRAPVAGIVKGLHVNTIGSIIEPGDIVAEIVPVADVLIVESRVSTSDVGHLHPGQRVEIKVKSFEAAKFGTLDGTLQRVSPSTYLDEHLKPYYRAEISLTQAYLGDDPSQNQLIPGMTVEAAIVTGRKTVLDYILKPVYRGFQSAFRER